MLAPSGSEQHEHTQVAMLTVKGCLEFHDKAGIVLTTTKQLQPNCGVQPRLNLTQ